MRDEATEFDSLRTEDSAVAEAVAEAGAGTVPPPEEAAHPVPDRRANEAPGHSSAAEERRPRRSRMKTAGAREGEGFIRFLSSMIGKRLDARRPERGNGARKEPRKVQRSSVPRPRVRLVRGPGPHESDRPPEGSGEQRAADPAVAEAPGGPRRRKDHGGRLFTIYKFRTMEVGDGPEGQVWATEDDPRVTPIGRFLRRYRLDELPQLFNVLLGDMNVVGPRPEQPKIFDDLREEIDEYPERQRVLPGITGWAQVNHHYDRSLDDVRKKVAYDLEYIDRESALEDFRIMVRTLPAVVFKNGGW